MSAKRGHRGRVDGHHAEVLDTLRSLGWLTLSLAEIGRGCPDALAYRQGIWRLIEVKQPSGKLTLPQVAFIQKGWPVDIVRGMDDVVKL